jgi:hypothetical protein
VFRMRDVWRTPAARAAGAVLVTALAVGACSPRESGAAAVVGDRRITTDQLSGAVAGIKRGNPQLGANQGLDRTVLFFLIISPYVLRAAEAKGVGVSDAQAAKLLVRDIDPDPDAVQVLRTYLALQALQEAKGTAELQQVQQEVAAVKPRLNPRYGRFDTKELTVVSETPNWLASTDQPTSTDQPSVDDRPTAP